MAKVVARPWLNPEKDSDGMTCAESAEGWETNFVCLLLSGRILPQLQDKNTTSIKAVSQTISICFRDEKLVVPLNEVCQRPPV